ncbi:MAG: hypothetical protein EOO02_01605, partial [Chitinophagaceae bacterium]
MIAIQKDTLVRSQLTAAIKNNCPLKTNIAGSICGECSFAADFASQQLCLKYKVGPFSLAKEAAKEHSS